MAQTASKGVDIGFLEAAVEGISSPIILGLVIVACAVVYNAPAIIAASAEAIRLGRENKVETEGRRNLLNSQLKSLEDKRLRRKRRDKQ